MKQLKENVKAVWGEYKDENDKKFAVIREFNMTKANVFPRKMLDCPEKAICLYLLKKETKKKIAKKQTAGKLLGVEGLKQYFRMNILVPIPGQWGHGGRIIQGSRADSKKIDYVTREQIDQITEGMEFSCDMEWYDKVEKGIQ